MQIGDFIDLLSICYVLIPTDQNGFFQILIQSLL